MVCTKERKCDISIFWAICMCTGKVFTETGFTCTKVEESNNLVYVFIYNTAQGVLQFMNPKDDVIETNFGQKQDI